jgi:hypothetical protein
MTFFLAALVATMAPWCVVELAVFVAGADSPLLGVACELKHQFKVSLAEVNLRFGDIQP